MRWAAKNKVIRELREIGKIVFANVLKIKVIYGHSSPTVKQMIKFGALEMLIPVLV